MEKPSIAKRGNIVVEFIHVLMASVLGAAVYGFYLPVTEGAFSFVLWAVGFTLAMQAAIPFIIFATLFLHFMRRTRLSRNQILIVLGLIFFSLSGLFFSLASHPLWDLESPDRFGRLLGFSTIFVMTASLIFYLILRHYRDRLEKPKPWDVYVPDKTES